MSPDRLQAWVGVAWGIATVLLAWGIVEDSTRLLAAAIFIALLAIWLQSRVDMLRTGTRVDRALDRVYFDEENEEGTITRLPRKHG